MPKMDTNEIPEYKVDETASDELDSEVVYLDLDIKKVPRYYSTGSAPDIKDLVVYVRSRYPNPRRCVIINCTASVPTKELADLFIFVNSDTVAEEVSKIRGLSSKCYCLIEATESRLAMPGYGILDTVGEFCALHSLSTCEVLVYGDNLDVLSALWEYVQDSQHWNFKTHFPYKSVTGFRLLDNGVDIAPYAEKLDLAYGRNSLTVSLIQRVLKELADKVNNEGKVVLQNFEETRSIYAKWITQVLTHNYSLSPMYMNSFLSEYLDLEIGYPLEKLSMFERINYLNKLPKRVGFVTKYTSKTCIFDITTKILPSPTVVYSLADKDFVVGDLSEFKLGNVSFIDWRKWFAGSPGYFANNSGSAKHAGILPIEMSDPAADDALLSIFLDMISKCGEEVLFPSVRNTALMLRNGKYYIAYYSEPLGIYGVMVSEYFGRENYVLRETEFYQLIDVKFVLSSHRVRSVQGTVEKAEQTRELVSKLASTFNTAIPPQISMYATLVGNAATELSYYDKRLRCDKVLLPSITHADVKSSDQIGLFDLIDILNVGRDPIASRAISSFGSINSECGYLDKLPVCIESFRRCSLL